MSEDQLREEHLIQAEAQEMLNETWASDPDLYHFMHATWGDEPIITYAQPKDIPPITLESLAEIEESIRLEYPALPRTRSLLSRLNTLPPLSVKFEGEFSPDSFPHSIFRDTPIFTVSYRTGIGTDSVTWNAMSRVSVVACPGYNRKPVRRRPRKSPMRMSFKWREKRKELEACGAIRRI